jgi:hypothetical protein
MPVSQPFVYGKYQEHTLEMPQKGMDKLQVEFIATRKQTYTTAKCLVFLRFQLLEMSE